MLAAYLDALRIVAQPIRAVDYPRSLQPLRHLLAALGNSHLQFPAVVVAGSVGKGTTCFHIAQRLQASSLKVGLYTSPHLHSFRERFMIDGTMISQAEFVDGLEKIHAAVGATAAAWQVAQPEVPIFSTFEQATALALHWFAQNQVDIAVLEVGLGGRWDAVSVVPNVLSVITPIEAEHSAMLGGSLQTIAWHKAGIIPSNGIAITVTQSAEVLDILRHEAEQKHATLNIVPDYDVLASAVWHHLQARGIIPPVPEPDITPGSLPGRQEVMQIAGRTVLIDGAHTPSGGRRLRAEVDRLVKHTGQSVHLVVGMLGDKAARDFLDILDQPHFHIILTQAPGHRAVAAYTLGAQFQPKHATVELVPDLIAALRQVYQAENSLFVVTGSLRMAAAARETYGLLSTAELAEAQATRMIFEGEDYLAKLG
jgi:dihydrofolate synthase / folylpolyglutamate synthase